MAKRRNPKRGKKSDKTRELTGAFQGTDRGFGFVRPDQSEAEDVFIPAPYVGPALHGDRVIVRKHDAGRDGRPYGEITKVIEWSKAPIVGLFNGLSVVPRDARYNAWIKVHHADAGHAEDGDVVAVEVTKRNVKGVFGRVVSVLGKSDEPGIESRVALANFGFDDGFPADALEEAEAAPDKVTPADLAGREDLRDTFTITIDPASSRDFDDAVAIERTEHGLRLWVSIADVANYVLPGSAIDNEAYQRATSVYMPDRAVHMLPEALSAGICSLVPGQDRMAMTAEMEFNKKGRRVRARMYESVIHSDFRLSYDQVERMEHDPKLRDEFPGVWDKILLSRELMKLRRRRRLNRGAVDLEMAECWWPTSAWPSSLQKRAAPWSTASTSRRRRHRPWPSPTSWRRWGSTSWTRAPWPRTSSRKTSSAPSTGQRARLTRRRSRSCVCAR